MHFFWLCLFLLRFFSIPLDVTKTDTKKSELSALRPIMELSEDTILSRTKMMSPNEREIYKLWFVSSENKNPTVTLTLPGWHFFQPVSLRYNHTCNAAVVSDWKKVYSNVKRPLADGDIAGPWIRARGGNRFFSSISAYGTSVSTFFLVSKSCSVKCQWGESLVLDRDRRRSGKWLSLSLCLRFAFDANYNKINFDVTFFVGARLPNRSTYPKGLFRGASSD